MRRVALVLALAMVACSSPGDSPVPGSPPTTPCEAPPVSEISAGSQLDMSIVPNPAPSRATVSLAIAATGLPVDALAGVDAAWQCWDGTRWVTTHVVYRGFGDRPGQTIPVNESFQIRVPSIGLPLDVGYPIVIPEVDPGLYRIEDEIILPDESVTGFVIVEVVAS